MLTQQALNEGKPAKIVERMVEGRIEKYYKEVCLLEQPFVKDPDINVTKMLGGRRPTSFASCALSAARVLRSVRTTSRRTSRLSRPR